MVARLERLERDHGGCQCGDHRNDQGEHHERVNLSGSIFAAIHFKTAHYLPTVVELSQNHYGWYKLVSIPLT